MTFDIRAEDHVWSVDATWIVFPRHPAARMLRQRAHDFGATHYALVAKAPFLVGFFDFKDYRGKRKSIMPLAPALAGKLGKQVYAEIELGDDQLWVIATSDAGRLLPGSDHIVPITEREQFRKRFPTYGFTSERHFDPSEFDALIADLPIASYSLKEASLGHTYRVAGSCAAAFVIAVVGARAWQAHEATIQAQQAAAERARQLRLEAARREALARINAPIAPSEWIAGCVERSLDEPAFRRGWIQTGWSCSGAQLALTWVRAGGTLADAPDGDLDLNGNRIVQKVAVTFKRTRSARAIPGDGMRHLVSSLQQVGVQPRINQGVAGAAGLPASTDVTWEFPADPRSPLWDTVGGLSIHKMTHNLGLGPSGLSDATDAPAYVMSATIAAPMLAGARP